MRAKTAFAHALRPLPPPAFWYRSTSATYAQMPFKHLLLFFSLISLEVTLEYPILILNSLVQFDQQVI